MLICLCGYHFLTLIGYGQRHKALQDIIYVARERKYLLATKARYAGRFEHVLF